MQHNVEIITKFRPFCSNECPGFEPEMHCSEIGNYMERGTKRCTVSCSHDGLCRNLMSYFSSNGGGKDVAESV